MTAPLRGPIAMQRLVRVARRAGAAAVEYHGRPGTLSHKPDGSPVTAADTAAQAVIGAELRQWTPDIPMISEEETPPPFEVRRHWTRFWLVDPLDGTKEFLAGNGEFTVNIALIDRGEPVLGVVAAPALDVVYVAAAGLGTWRLTGTKAPVRLAPDASRAGVLRVVESRSHTSPEGEAFIASLGAVERIRLGSSLKFCRLAEGAADLYPRFGPTMEWDVAAGDCVYRNASRTGQQRESPLVYNQPNMRIDRFVIGTC